MDHSNTKTYDNNDSSILVVDDEDDTVDLVKKSLEVIGQKMCGFTNATTALDHFNSNPNDNHSIVISDIRMPGMNGYEFVTRIKEINPKIKVILMSSFEIQEKEFHNMLPYIRIDGFMQKPFSIRALRDIVQKYSVLSR